jgi:serine/threonine protein kinase/WD40 repeat protein
MRQDARNADTLFAQAIEIASPQERAAFLENACANDPELRREVEKLVADYFRAGAFLEQPVAHIAGAGDQPLTEGPGSRIGPYKLLQKLGEGGMGVVYMAEQEQPVRRRVALKIIKAGMDSQQVVARFEQERQALALMDHPHIAKVLDAGATASGRPYFAMELVKGIPLTKFCDQEQLTPRERLELLIPVCHAVQHAHQKGIIHRDLKPSNVLIALYDGQPVPKVIDFGVAKATGQRLTERTLFTEVGSLVGTLEYMAPEQAELNNLDIDTRADIYSLGVLLYELLTGSPPFSGKELRAATFEEMLRMLREVEPPKPSTKLSSSTELPAIAAKRKLEAKRLTKLVHGDLDWIVMKCLAKERNRRYETANSLAMDIEHYLREEPVRAGPPGTGYRLRKFARKHRGPLAAAAVVLLALLGAIVGTTLGMIRAEEERKKADEAREAATVNESKARDSEARAVEAAGRLRDARDELWSNLYAARANLIQNAWEADNLGRVRELLDEQIPKAGERDLRGFEWHYWRHQANAELRAMPIPSEWWAAFHLLSPDGRRLTGYASVGKSNHIQVRDTLTGAELLSVEARLFDTGAGGGLLQLRYSPDGTRLVAAVDQFGAGTHPTEGRLRVWDAITGKVLLTLKGLPLLRNVPLVISPDNRRVAAALKPAGAAKPGGHDVIRQWDIASGKELAPLQGFPGIAGALTFSPDGTRLVAVAKPADGEREAVVILWDPTDGKEKLRFKASGAVSDVAFSPDGTRLAGSGNDLIVWDAATGKELYSVKGTPVTARAMFSPDGTCLACFSNGPVVTLRDAATGRPRRVLKGHASVVLSAAFSADGKTLVTAGKDRTVKVWDATANDQPLRLGGDARNSPLAFSADGTRIAAVFRKSQDDGTELDEVRVWDVTGKLLFSIDRRVPFSSQWSDIVWPALSPNGQRVAYCRGARGVADGKERAEAVLKVWDITSGRELLDISSEPGFKHLTFSPDGAGLAYVTGDIYGPRTGPAAPCVVKIVDAATGRELLRIPVPTFGGFGYLRFSPDGRLLAFAGAGVGHPSVLQVWDAATGREVLALKNLQNASPRLAFSPDGTRLAVMVNVYEVATGRHTLTLKGQGGRIESVAFSPDGTRIVSTGELENQSGEAKVWDALTGKELLTLPGHRGSPAALFSADGLRLITAGTASEGPGCEVKVWDAAPVPAE